MSKEWVVLVIALGVVHAGVVKRQAPDSTVDSQALLANIQKQAMDTIGMINKNFGADIDWQTDASEPVDDDELLRQVQQKTFEYNNMTNLMLQSSLDPDVVANCLQVTQTASNPTDAEAMSKRCSENYRNVYRKKLGAQNGQQQVVANEGSSSLESINNQIIQLSQMYNTALTDAMKPEDITGALSGSGPQSEKIAGVIGNVISNVFQTLAKNRKATENI